MKNVDRLRFVVDPLTGTQIRKLIATHLATMRSQSPACSVHAMEIEALQAPDIHFWSAWVAETLVGCAALKRLDDASGEIKSMHIDRAWRGQGFANALLQHLEHEALALGMRRLSLETGSQDAFDPARQLYARSGYTPCPPFGDYVEDPNSVFMSKALP